MSASAIESFGLRRSAAVATAVYVLVVVATLAYMAVSVSLDGVLLVAAALWLSVSVPACYYLLVRQWREFGIEPAEGS
jgi:hypothetical protein